MMAYEVKKLTMQEYREKIEDHGCPNCGTSVQVRPVQTDHENWSKWRCPEPNCIESEDWTNIWEDLENTPF